MIRNQSLISWKKMLLRKRSITRTLTFFLQAVVIGKASNQLRTINFPQNYCGYLWQRILHFQDLAAQGCLQTAFYEFQPQTSKDYRDTHLVMVSARPVHDYTINDVQQIVQREKKRTVSLLLDFQFLTSLSYFSKFYANIHEQ